MDLFSGDHGTDHHRGPDEPHRASPSTKKTQAGIFGVKGFLERGRLHFILAISLGVQTVPRVIFAISCPVMLDCCTLGTA